MESKSSNKKSKVKLKKGNPTSHGTPISHPFNFEHREHKTPDDVVDELTNNPGTPDVTDQPLLPPPCPGNTNIDEQLALSISNLRGDIIQSLRSDIRTELKDMTSYLTETIKSQMKFAISGGHCTLCRNEIEESKYVNQLVNEKEVIKHASDVIMPQACKLTEDSYVNIQDVDEDTYVAPITKNDNVSKTRSNVSNPTYNRSTEDDIIMSTITSSVKTTTDDNHNLVRKESNKHPIPVPRTSTSGSDKHAFSSLGFNVSQELELSMTYPKEAWSDETEIKLTKNTMSDETQAKQFTGQSIYQKSHNKGLPRPVQRIKQSKAKGRHRLNFDERECLARALQTNVQEIVATVVFKESELPDALTAGGVITEDESSAIQTIVYRKDQIRVLLSLIKGRDLQILNKFLKYIGEHCGSRELIDKIMSMFENNKKANITGKSCAICRLSDQVNIKYVTDKLWSIFAIDDGVYNESIMCTNPTGSQHDLWDQLICCINNLKADGSTFAYDALCSTLKEKDHYTHLSEAIKSRTSTEWDGKLKHTCDMTSIQLFQRSKRGTTSSFGTSISPCSSSQSSTRNSQELLQDDNGNNTSPSRSFERGKRLSEMDLEIQTAILESQFEGSETENVLNIDIGYDHVDKISLQSSGQRSEKPPPLPQKKKQQDFKRERTKAIEDDDLHSSDV